MVCHEGVAGLMRGLDDGLPNMGHGLTWLFGMIVIVGPTSLNWRDQENHGRPQATTHTTSRLPTGNNTHEQTKL
jgi:hypothetical protein